MVPPNEYLDRERAQSIVHRLRNFVPFTVQLGLSGFRLRIWNSQSSNLKNFLGASIIWQFSQLSDIMQHPDL